MQPRERDNASLWDMREAARLIASFLNGVSYADYEKNLMLRSALERQLEIIGEAARRVSPEFQQAHPEIAWRNITGLRNILAHEYGEIKVDRIWFIATTNVVELIRLLDPLIPPIDDAKL
jgi:uncharacterized protein with HEPN domain